METMLCRHTKHSNKAITVAKNTAKNSNLVNNCDNVKKEFQSKKLHLCVLQTWSCALITTPQRVAHKTFASNIENSLLTAVHIELLKGTQSINLSGHGHYDDENMFSFIFLEELIKDKQECAERRKMLEKNILSSSKFLFNSKDHNHINELNVVTDFRVFLIFSQHFNNIHPYFGYDLTPLSIYHIRYIFVYVVWFYSVGQASYFLFVF